jgi:hypothetical protein
MALRLLLLIRQAARHRLAAASRLAPLGSLLVALAGCRGADDDYQDYLARRQAPAGDEQMVQSTLQDLNGMWLLHALLAGGLDLGLRVELHMDTTQQPIPLHARMWLASADPTADAPVVETDSTVAADGTFTLHAEPLKLAKGSTPGLNVDVNADVVLQAATQSLTSWCGTATGMVKDPLSLDLQGSTFAARPDSRSLQLTDVPQSCFPKTDNGMTPVETPKPPSPDLSSVSSVNADISGNWIITANLAASVPLQLWAELIYTPGTPDGGTFAGSLDGALRRATDSPGSLALASFTTQVTSDGRFEVWLPQLVVGQTQASVLLVGATRSADVLCGAGAGRVHKPIDLDLTGTTFGAVRWTPGTPVPDPTVNHCE